MPMKPTRCRAVSPAAAAVPVPGALSAGARGDGPECGADTMNHKCRAQFRKRTAGGDR